jgi:Asp-tRNA(Asn)/Glu-tRNA(Gln) amidotransferase A subunit family amidase
VGRPWSEALLLRIADAFQRATDWHARRFWQGLCR